MCHPGAELRGIPLIKIPDERFDSLVHISYAWEATDEAAKKTQVTPGIIRFGTDVYLCHLGQPA